MKDISARATIKALEKTKERRYSDFIRKAKSHPAVVARSRVINYKTVAFTSLVELGEGAVKFFNGALSFYKSKLTLELRKSPRPDRLTPQELTAQLRFQYLALIQFAIAAGKSALTAAVGL